MREINTHKVNGCNEAITVQAVDEPGSGGANHQYWMSYPVTVSEEQAAVGIRSSSQTQCIGFQNGPIAEVGTNGITHEVLLAILQDRLEGFQKGPYACDDNAQALDHIKAAQAALQRRTIARVARGVEGTHTV